MFFRILLISMISWAVFKLFRVLTGRGRRAPAPFQQNARRRSYEGKAVDAQFEEVDGDDGKSNDD